MRISVQSCINLLVSNINKRVPTIFISVSAPISPILASHHIPIENLSPFIKFVLIW